MELKERDFRVFRELVRWRVCLGRHIQFLAGFSSPRTCDRRLRGLVGVGLLSRHLVLYGVPNVYQLTRKSKTLISANQRQEQIRLDQIMHDVTVLDVAICFMKSLGLKNEDIQTEKQLHQQDGFGTRIHHPDFIFAKDNKIYCVEVELSIKSKARLEKNIKSNFMKYDTQIWITDEIGSPNGNKLSCILENYKTPYPNIEISNVKEIKNGSFKFIDPVCKSES